MWWSSFTGSRGQERYERYVKFEQVQLSVEELFQLLDYTAISIKVVGENGECRTEVTRPNELWVRYLISKISLVAFTLH